MLYVLRGHEPVMETDELFWASWMEEADVHVQDTEVEGVRVSTVFLGVDHGMWQATPILFETMVFGGSMDGEQERYARWAEAEVGHEEMVARVRRSLGRTVMTDRDIEHAERRVMTMSYHQLLVRLPKVTMRSKLEATIEVLDNRLNPFSREEKEFLVARYRERLERLYPATRRSSVRRDDRFIVPPTPEVRGMVPAGRPHVPSIPVSQRELESVRSRLVEQATRMTRGAWPVVTTETTAAGMRVFMAQAVRQGFITFENGNAILGLLTTEDSVRRNRAWTELINIQERMHVPRQSEPHRVSEPIIVVAPSGPRAGYRRAMASAEEARNARRAKELVRLKKIADKVQEEAGKPVIKRMVRF